MLPFLHALTVRSQASLAPPAIALAFAMTASAALLPPAPGPLDAATLLEANPFALLGLAAPIAVALGCVGWLWSFFVASTPHGPRLILPPLLLFFLIPILLPSPPSGGKMIDPRSIKLAPVISKEVTDWKGHVFWSSVPLFVPGAPSSLSYSQSHPPPQ